MRLVSFLFVNTKRVSSTPILFEQFMRRCFKKVGESIKDQMDNFNEEERDTLSVPIPFAVSPRSPVYKTRGIN